MPTVKPTRIALGSLTNLPNQLTSLRLLLSIVLFYLIASEHYIASFVMFIIAAGTDWLDGYFAGSTTRLLLWAASLIPLPTR